MKGTMKVAVMNGIGKMGYTTRPIQRGRGSCQAGIRWHLRQRYALL